MSYACSSPARPAAFGAAYGPRVLPGTYTVLAVAQGYNPITYRSVEINRSVSEAVESMQQHAETAGVTLQDLR